MNEQEVTGMSSSWVKPKGSFFACSTPHVMGQPLAGCLATPGAWSSGHGAYAGLTNSFSVGLVKDYVLACRLLFERQQSRTYVFGYLGGTHLSQTTHFLPVQEAALRAWSQPT